MGGVGRFRSLKRLVGCGALAALASVQAAQLTLTWQDNSDDELGFNIERSTNGGSFAQIASVGPNVVTYVDTSVVAGTAYSYRVAAYNAVGNSPYANVVTNAPAITTQPTDQVATAYQNATFTAAVSGVPAPSVRWQKNGVDLADGGVVSGSSTTTLTLTGVTVSDATTYTLTATNGIGTSAVSNAAALTVNKRSQTITFPQPSNVTYGPGAQFTLSATSDSGLPVSFSSSNTSVVTVSGSTGTTIGVGTTTITPIQAGDANTLAAANAVPRTLQVTPASQTITFPAIAPVTYGVGTITLAATSSSGLPITYLSFDTSVATVNGNQLNIVGAGGTNIAADQSGNANYLGANRVQQSLSVAKANQNITFGALASAKVGDAPITLGGTATSGLAVSYTSSNPAVATVSGNTLTVVAPGSTSITASQAGTNNYNAASSVIQAFTVTKGNQTITFGGLANQVFGVAPFAVAATSTSGLPVTFSIASGPATATGTNGSTITVTGAGTVVVNADQAGNSGYNAAGTVQQSFTVAKATPVITWAAPAGINYGTALSATQLSATSSVPGTFAYTPATGTILNAGAGQTLGVTFTPTDTADYNSANASTTITVAKVTPSLSWPAPSAISSGTALSATQLNATSPVPGTFVYTPPTGTVLGPGAGQTLSVAFTPTDTTDYNSTSTTTTISVNAAPQTITFGSLTGQSYGVAPFTVSATATSGLPVSFSVLSGPATASGTNGSTITVTGVGTVVVRASQAGNTIYNAAAPVDQPFVVAKTTPVITWATPAAVTYGTALSATQLNASTTIAGTFTYTPATGTILNAGAGQALSVTFTPTDTVNYNGSSGSTTITVNQAAQTITFGALASHITTDAPFTLTGSASSGLSVAYTSSNTAVATVSGNTVTVVGPGSTNLTATQPGNANFLAASPVAQALSVLAPTAPSFTTQPSNQSGSSAAFVVVAAGVPTPTLQWQTSADGSTNWTNLSASGIYSGVTAATLVISGATPGTYYYRCLAANGVGTNAVSSAASLSVSAPPATPTTIAPFFLVQPSSQSVPAGTNVFFSAAAAGSPTPALQWFKNGAPISGATSGSLGLGAVTIADAATYTVSATSSSGSVVSQSAVLTVAAAPVITNQSGSQSVVAGASVTFSVTATGSPALTYQWFKSGALVAGATSSVLSLSAVTAADAATYTVAVTNSVGSVTSAGAVLTVAALPVITTQPASQSASIGATAAFSVAVSGTGPFSYQWRKNTVPLASSTSSILSLSGIQAADAANYDVVVSNAAGSVTSNPAVLTVSALPVITTQPASRTVSVGASVTFSVAISGTAPVSYQWRKGGVALAGATGSSLSFSPVQTTDAGTYDVVVSNSSGSVTSSGAALIVNPSPFAGTYFGSFSGGGSWALYVRTDNTATYIAYSSDKGVAVVLNLVVKPDGTFSVDGSAISSQAVTPSGAAGTVGFEPRTAAAAGAVTLTGSITGGQLSGQLIGLGLTLSGSLDQGGATASTSAGLYKASALGSASGATYSIVGASGQAVVVTAGPALVDGATGKVGADGNLSVTTSAGAKVAVTLSAQSQTVSATYTPANSTTSVTFAGVADSAPAVFKLANLSIRSSVGTGNGTLIVGFVINGTSSRSMLVRGIGPSLEAFGVTGALQDPTLTLYAGASVVGANDDWGTGGNPAQIAATAASVGAFALPAASRDAVVLSSLGSGAYTAQLLGKGATTGVALIEIYDAGSTADAQLVNISGRSIVGGTAGPLIAGFVIQGNTPRQLLVRAIGPTLGAFGVTGALADPVLELYQGSSRLFQNDDWGGGSALVAAFGQVGAFGISNPQSKDSALLVTLQPGSYSAVISGANGTSGVALIEVYLMP
jgi:hypothetical protein